MKRYTRITTMVGGGPSLRTATLHSIVYTVYPGIAIVGDVVVRPMNSPGPEFVPAGELSYAPASWNGRPIIPDHPINDEGVAVSANDPELLEALQYGIIFNTTFDDNKLKTELWIDEAKAAILGGEPARVLECLQKGETVEVSIGAYIDVEAITGIHNGEEYIGVWHNITPDHLAVGLNGAKGACSVEMGAGAPRVNKQAADRQRGLMRAAEEGEGNDDTPIPHSLMKRIARRIRRLATHTDIEKALDNLLWDIEPYYGPYYDDWLTVDQEISTVYYYTYSQNGSGHNLWSRTYEVNGENIPVSLNDDAVQVVKKSVFVPAKDEHGNDKPDRARRLTMEPSKEVLALVKQLIDNEATPFGKDREVELQGMAEGTLRDILAPYAKVEGDDDKDTGAPVDVAPTPDPVAPAAPIEAVTPPAPADGQNVILPAKDYQNLLAGANFFAQHQQAAKANLVASIKANPSNKLTDDQLNALPDETLTATAASFAPVEAPNAMPSFRPVAPTFAPASTFIASPESGKPLEVPKGISAAIAAEGKGQVTRR